MIPFITTRWCLQGPCSCHCVCVTFKEMTIIHILSCQHTERVLTLSDTVLVQNQQLSYWTCQSVVTGVVLSCCAVAPKSHIHNEWLCWRLIVCESIVSVLMVLAAALFLYFSSQQLHDPLLLNDLLWNSWIIDTIWKIVLFGFVFSCFAKPDRFAEIPMIKSGSTSCSSQQIIVSV